MLILTELIFAIKHSIVESILPRSDHDWFDWTDSSVFELIFPGSKPDCFFWIFHFQSRFVVEYLIMFCSFYLVCLHNEVTYSVFYHPSSQLPSTLLLHPIYTVFCTEIVLLDHIYTVFHVWKAKVVNFLTDLVFKLKWALFLLFWLK